MEQIVKTLGKYVITAILVVFGLFFLFKYLSGDEIETQPIEMLISALILVALGVLAAPDVLQHIGKKATVIVLFCGLAVTAYLGYSVYFSIDDEIAFQEKREKYEDLTKRRLIDIRSAQEAYEEANGKFTNNFDTLLEWIQKPAVAIPYSSGTFYTDSMPEDKYYEMGYVLTLQEVDSVAIEMGYSPEDFSKLIEEDQTAYKVRDNIFTTFFAENFTPEKRAAKKLPPVDLDSLPFTPSSGKRFIMRTSTANQGGVTKSTILVQDPTPFGREKVVKDTLRFGNLKDPITDGNWK